MGLMYFLFRFSSYSFLSYFIKVVAHDGLEFKGKKGPLP